MSLKQRRGAIQVEINKLFESLEEIEDELCLLAQTFSPNNAAKTIEELQDESIPNKRVEGIVCSINKLRSNETVTFSKEDIGLRSMECKVSMTTLMNSIEGSVKKINKDFSSQRDQCSLFKKKANANNSFYSLLSPPPEKQSVSSQGFPVKLFANSNVP